MESYRLRGELIHYAAGASLGRKHRVEKGNTRRSSKNVQSIGREDRKEQITREAGI